MTEGERGAVDEVGLLRALAEQAMQENGLADAQGAASVSIVPSTASVAAAGMDIGTPRYDAAVGRLLEAGALERDEEIDRPRGDVPGEPEAFRITSSGIDLLQNRIAPARRAKTCGSYPLLEVLSGGETEGLAELFRHRTGPAQASGH